jgi:hypothetical protein
MNSKQVCANARTHVRAAATWVGYHEYGFKHGVRAGRDPSCHRLKRRRQRLDLDDVVNPHGPPASRADVRITAERDGRKPSGGSGGNLVKG